MELSNYVEARGPSGVSENIRGVLAAIDRNEEFI